MAKMAVIKAGGGLIFLRSVAFLLECENSGIDVTMISLMFPSRKRICLGLVHSRVTV